MAKAIIQNVNMVGGPRHRGSCSKRAGGWGWRETSCCPCAFRSQAWLVDPVGMSKEKEGCRAWRCIGTWGCCLGLEGGPAQPYSVIL